MALKFKALLSDIEGTTTSIDFVKNILFPFAAEHVQQYISQLILSSRNCTNEQIELIEDLIKTSNECASLDSTISKIEQNDEDAMLADKLVKNIRQWIQLDKKLTPLKTLQGMIWEDGYKGGQLKADVYPDVPNVLAKLSQASIPIYIYSSGSVQAQQLLFAHTNSGDLTKYISGYFDTNIGPKMEAESYQKIAAQIGIQPEEILFLTDIEKEAIAAHSAGLQVRLALREGNEPLSAECLAKFQTIRSFEEILQ